MQVGQLLQECGFILWKNQSSCSLVSFSSLIAFLVGPFVWCEFFVGVSPLKYVKSEQSTAGASLVNGGLSVTLTKSFNCLNRLCVFASCWSFRPDIYACGLCISAPSNICVSLPGFSLVSTLDVCEKQIAKEVYFDFKGSSCWVKKKTVAGSKLRWQKSNEISLLRDSC